MFFFVNVKSESNKTKRGERKSWERGQQRQIMKKSKKAHMLL
jgi:hypothetical protein